LSEYKKLTKQKVAPAFEDNRERLAPVASNSQAQAAPIQTASQLVIQKTANKSTSKKPSTRPDG
jgi:hypothetical protein